MNIAGQRKIQTLSIVTVLTALLSIAVLSGCTRYIQRGYSNKIVYHKGYRR